MKATLTREGRLERKSPEGMEWMDRNWEHKLGMRPTVEGEGKRP
jgi:hypothetical protein